MSFENLRKKSASMIDAINKAKQKPSQENSKQADTRFWRPTLDDAKNANAVIRFLPPAEGEDNPFVRTYSHGFKAENGRWYIEESLTTIGQPDPVYVWNDKVWKLGHDAAKKLVRDRKRKEHFISNILVINDPASPENNGKVFLYKYGKQIFDKIHAKLNPEFDDQTRINVFDLWEGANFRLRVKQKDRHITFEFSEFDGISELFGGDTLKIITQLHQMGLTQQY
jgi:hypothetical protein